MNTFIIILYFILGFIFSFICYRYSFRRDINFYNNGDVVGYGIILILFTLAWPIITVFYILIILYTRGLKKIDDLVDNLLKK